MFHSSKSEFIEDIALVAGLMSVQVVYAIYAVFMSYLMSIGLHRVFLIIFGSFSTFIFLFPLSICFERITLFQALMLTGLEKTSPGIASAMPNLAPGLIFFIAWSLRLEKVKVKSMYSKVKIVGTLVCIIGAVTMSFMQGPAASHTLATAPTTSAVAPPAPELSFDKNKIIGCMYLMAAVFVQACTIVLQATALGDFPAPMSLCATTSLIGSILTLIIQLIQEHKFDTGWPILSVQDLIAYALMGGSVTGACVSFQAWSMKKKGPVLVSMFTPIGTLSSVVLSAVTLGDSITLGSLAGMFLMFAGLYFFLWAKGKENYAVEDYGFESTKDAEKPLLS
ncbi:hypothetical protein HHK36_027993 [Tetracentron sinense]|uniref:WAT1-related protein n=1 Tax=Tetracentron sinense TaxID=13715 RepID=A0A834YJ35_TETSI|nr:hypothetical protein HHK36_027993 [Tetracentron sinense]